MISNKSELISEKVTDIQKILALFNFEPKPIDLRKLGKDILNELDNNLGQDAIDTLVCQRRLINEVSLDRSYGPAQRWYILNENITNESSEQLFKSLLEELPEKDIQLVIRELSRKQKQLSESNKTNVSLFTVTLGSCIPKSVVDKIQRRIK